MNYETASEIECAVAHYFNPRLNLIIPNVTWGMHLNFECDLAIATAAGYLNEVEIKCSRSDLMRDKEKDKWRYHAHLCRIRQLWFAVPERLRGCMADIPEKAGFLVVSSLGHVTQLRRPAVDRSARKLTENERYQMARLGALRIWTLKTKQIQLEARLREARAKIGDTKP